MPRERLPVGRAREHLFADLLRLSPGLVPDFRERLAAIERKRTDFRNVLRNLHALQPGLGERTFLDFPEGAGKRDFPEVLALVKGADLDGHHIVRDLNALDSALPEAVAAYYFQGAGEDDAPQVLAAPESPVGDERKLRWKLDPLKPAVLEDARHLVRIFGRKGHT